MMDENWRDTAYQKIYEETRDYIEVRKQNDPRFTKQELEGMLKSAWFEQGNDWTGRGVTKSIQINATIAAYESCLADWE